MKRLFLSILTLSVMACEDSSPIEIQAQQSEQAEIQSTLKIINGMFSFETIDDFETTVKKVGSLNSEEYKNWLQTNNITTLYAEYSSLSPNVSLQELSKTRPELIFFNKRTNSYELNSINSNYARITNNKGLVIINNASYQFSATEIKCIKGFDQEAVNMLLSTEHEEYKSKNIISSVVQEGFKPRGNAKMGPWEKQQKGNNINNMPNWDGAYYLKATLRCRYYWIPNPNPIIPGMDIGKMSIEIDGKYYREKGLFASDQQVTPQHYNVIWAFELSDGMNFGTYYPYSGNYTESGIETFSRVFYDGYPCDIRNLNIPVTAMDFNKDGASVTSTTTFVISN